MVKLPYENNFNLPLTWRILLTHSCNEVLAACGSLITLLKMHILKYFINICALLCLSSVKYWWREFLSSKTCIKISPILNHIKTVNRCVQHPAIITYCKHSSLYRSDYSIASGFHKLIAGFLFRNPFSQSIRVSLNSLFIYFT